MKSIFLATTILFAGTCLNSQKAPKGFASSPTPAQIQAFRSTFHRICEERRIVGGSVMVLEAGRELLSETYGLQDANSRIPISQATSFHWASITKTFTSVAVLQARDRGLLSLDDPITKYLPELRKVHNPYGSMDAITLRHLMTHSAGFRDATWPWKRGKAWEPFEPTEWSQLVAMLPYSEIEFEPGTQFGYSNLGYILLGRVIELVTGDPFVSHVEKNILRPLGMAETYFDRAPYHLISRRSHSYTWTTATNPRKENPFDFLTGITTANGGLNGPLPDMAKYVQFLMGGEREPALNRSEVPVLSGTSLAELFTPVRRGWSDDSWRTLGFFRTKYKGVDWLEHTGGQNGFSSIIMIAPATGRALVMAFNTDDDRGAPIATLAEAFLDLVSPSTPPPSR